MTDIVDDYGRALVRLAFRNPDNTASAEWDAWVDTGFTGELLLTPAQAESLNLPLYPGVPGALADGSRVEFQARKCVVEWMGVSRPVVALIGKGRFALIGIRLLEDQIVSINYPARTVSIISGMSDISPPSGA
jgi:clan AA aspartic protease